MLKLLFEILISYLNWLETNSIWRIRQIYLIKLRYKANMFHVYAYIFASICVMFEM